MSFLIHGNCTVIPPGILQDKIFPVQSGKIYPIKVETYTDKREKLNWELSIFVHNDKDEEFLSKINKAQFIELRQGELSINGQADNRSGFMNIRTIYRPDHCRLFRIGAG